MRFGKNKGRRKLSLGLVELRRTAEAALHKSEIFLIYALHEQIN